jgi:protein disulfide-isomerase
MKNIAVALLVLSTCLSLTAAEAEWTTDLAKAQARAKTEKKMVLLDFTGSDWCAPCKALHKNVFASQEFAEFAKANLLLVEVDFPRNKTQSKELKEANKALGKKFEIDGYPTVVVLDHEGKQVLKETGYGGEDAKKFIAKIEKLKH